MNGFFTEAANVKWALQQSVGWTFLGFVVWGVFTYMVLPAQTEHFKLVDKVAENNTAIARTQEQQTPIINRIDRNTSK